MIKIDCQDTDHTPIRTKRASIDLAFDRLIETLSDIRRPLAHVKNADSDDLHEFADHYIDVASAVASYLMSYEEYIERTCSHLDLANTHLALSDGAVKSVNAIRWKAYEMEEGE